MKPELEFHPDHLPGHADPNAEADRLPINFAELIRQYRWWLACGLLVGLGIGQLLYMKLGPEYEASAQILVARKNAVPMKEDQRTMGNFGDRTEHLALILSPMIAGKAVEIARYADGLLLVMRLGKNRRPAAVRTRELIRSLNLPLLGVIANGVPDEGSTGVGYYHEYSRPNAVVAAAQPAHEPELVEV